MTFHLATATSDTPPTSAAASATLADLAKGEQACIRFLAAPQGAEQSALRERLEELGFLPGEIVRVVALSFPAGDPIAVRIGNTTFALRRHEAELIHIDRLA
jgi:ferrous iron transport protein A